MGCACSTGKARNLPGKRALGRERAKDPSYLKSGAIPATAAASGSRGFFVAVMLDV
jgi:hypothetical protein